MKINSNPRREERKKTINQIGDNDNPVFAEMYKMRALNSLIEDLEDSIHKHSKSTSFLSWVLIIATFIIATTGVINVYYTITSQGVGNCPQISEKLEK
jgi:hypothetical protein